MNEIRDWWSSVPDWAKPVLLTAVVGVLGWAVVRAVRVLLALAKRKHSENIEKLSHRIWAFIKSKSGPTTTGVPLQIIVSYFRVSEPRTKEALRLLKSKGVLRPNVDESLWWSDARTRFFN
jgi:hypothetical protein